MILWSFIMAHTANDLVVEFGNLPDNVASGVSIGEIAPLRRATGEVDFLVPVTALVYDPADDTTQVLWVFLVLIPAGVHS